MQAPPVGSENDYLSWIASQPYPQVTAYPTPIVSDCGVTCTGCPASCATPETKPTPLVGFPNPAHSQGFLRVEWTGQNGNSPQYLSLSQGKFENDNSPSGNWSNYGYLRFYEYCNEIVNKTIPDYVSQTVSLYDGNITVTSGAISIGTQGRLLTYTAEPWIYHVSVCLNYLANIYDTASGRYFSVSNVANVMIAAPQTYYNETGMPTPTIKSAFVSPSNSLILYYDYLTLGASTDLPYYDSPQNEIVTTAYNTSGSGNPVSGALIEWDELGTGASTYAQANSSYSSVTWVPVTAYHIYRLLAHSAGVGPYISVGIATGPSTSPASVTKFTDTTCPGGNTFCYKVLACNNGPTADWNNEKTNTINASYNEPLLNATNVIEICGYVQAPATPTPTLTPYLSPTVTSTYCTACPSPATPTITPILTATPVATVAGTPQLSNAYVYPNPFNPNGSVNGGDKLFHVGNVADGTQIHIYAMDGALVYDGTYTASTGGFTWNGTNKNSSKVVSGLYYLVLKDPKSSKTAVFRVIVCYKCDPVYKPQ